MLKFFDHVTLLVRDMDEAVARFGGLGFHVFDRGDQSTANMHNRLIRFTDGSFIELMSFRKPNVHDAHRFWPLLKIGEGWVDYAVSASDIGKYVRDMDELGIRTSGKKSISKTTRDGNEWKVELAIAGRGEGNPALPFLVDDLTPREWRIPLAASSERQPANLTGIAGVSVVTESLAAVKPAMTAIFGDGLEVEPIDDGVSAIMRYEFADCWVQVIEPSKRDSIYRTHLTTWGGGLFEVALRSGEPNEEVNWPSAETCHARLTTICADGSANRESRHG